MGTQKLGGVPIWFAGHRILQSVGVVLQLMGFFFALLWKKAAHFKLPHEILGLVMVILGTLQPVNAQLRNLSFVGHPHPDGTRSPLRKAWEVLHKGSGYIAVVMKVRSSLGKYSGGRREEVEIIGNST